MKKADCGIGHEREDAWGVCVPCTQSWTKSQASGRQYFSPFFSSVPFVSCFKIFKNRLFKITCADAGGLSGVTNVVLQPGSGLVLVLANCVQVWLARCPSHSERRKKKTTRRNVGGIAS